MTNEEIQSLLDRQRTYYRSGVTLPVKFRVEQLRRLYASVKAHQDEINDALTADLGKSRRNRATHGAEHSACESVARD